MTARAIPEGFTTVTATIVVEGAAEAMELYKKAFGATEEYRVPQPDGSGKIMHASIVIGSSKFFLADVSEKMGCSRPTQSNFYLYVDDVDVMFASAQKAGLTGKMAPQDMFYGDRVGRVDDKFGNIWTIATHVRDVSKEDMDKAMKAMANKAA